MDLIKDHNIKMTDPVKTGIIDKFTIDLVNQCLVSRKYDAAAFILLFLSKDNYRCGIAALLHKNC